jgi:hypothetical protein
MMKWIIGIVLLLLLVMIIVPALHIPHTPSPRLYDTNNLAQIGKACEIYQMEHDGHYPDTFADLVPYADAPKLYACYYDRKKTGAMSNVMDWTSFTLVAGLTTSAPPSSVLAYLPPGRHKGHTGGLILRRSTPRRKASYASRFSKSRLPRSINA